mmetsp:Transcript_39719/g.77752  ORF Transcript_39719/g.77752 Transcript_39719/m.77752 type:complete len:223 (-) Transcript_39719:17-685(-)
MGPLPVIRKWCTMPPMAIIARRPFLSSASSMRPILSPLPSPRGSNPKSPALRVLVSSVHICTTATVEKSSKKPIQKRSWPMAPLATAASWRAVIFELPRVSAAPGKVNMSWAMAPADASMATRQCLSSASRRNFMSRFPEMQRGSNPVSPAQVPSKAGVSGRPAKGIAVTPVPWLLPLSQSCMLGEAAVALRAVAGSIAPGAKAVAPAIEPMSRVFDSMVMG